MADNEQQMMLVAKLVDQVSDRLKEIQKSMLATESAAKKAHEGSAKAADEHRRANELLKKSFDQIKEVSAELIKPAFSAIGVSAFSLAGAIGAVVDAVKSLGEQGLALEMTSRRSGLLADKIRELQGIGLRWGVSMEQTNEGLQNFGAFMDQSARHAPDAMRAWAQMPGLWQALGRSLQGLSRQQQIDKVLDFLPRVRFQDQRRRILALLGLPENYAFLTIQELEQARREEQAWLQNHPFAKDVAAKADENFTKLSRVLQGLKDDLGAAFGGEVVKGMEKVDNFLSQPEHVEKFQAAMHKLAEDIKQEWVDVGAIFDAIRGVLDWDKRVSSSIKEKLGVTVDPFASILHGKAPSVFGDPPATFDERFGRWGSLKKPSSFTGSSSLADGIQKVGFSPYESRYVEEPIYRATLRALQEWWVVATGANPPGGGFRSAAFTPNEGVRRFGSSVYTNLGQSIGGVSNGTVTDDGAGTGLTGSAYLKARRQRFADEMNENPILRKQVEAMMTLEGAHDPIPVAESLMNRMEYIHGTLAKGLGVGNPRSFYGPVRSGLLSGAMARLDRDPRLRARMEKALNAALNGSNLIKGATDQGMVSDPNGRWPGGRVVREQVFNDWGGGPGGHEGARRFREAQQRAVNAERGSVAQRQAGNIVALTGKMADGKPAVGSASISVDFNNLPRGAKTKATYDGIFKQMKVNRGFAMPMASDSD